MGKNKISSTFKLVPAQVGPAAGHVARVVVGAVRLVVAVLGGDSHPDLGLGVVDQLDDDFVVQLGHVQSVDGDEEVAGADPGPVGRRVLHDGADDAGLLPGDGQAEASVATALDLDLYVAGSPPGTPLLSSALHRRGPGARALSDKACPNNYSVVRNAEAIGQIASGCVCVDMRQCALNLFPLIFSR